MSVLISDALRQRRLITVLVAVIILLLHALLHLALPASVIQWGSGIVMAFLLGDSVVEAHVHRAAATSSAAASPTAPPAN